MRGCRCVGRGFDVFAAHGCQTLIRDGFCCVISGRVNADSCGDFPQLMQVLGDKVMEKTETAHIVPVATAEDLENAQKACLDVHHPVHDHS